MQLSFVGHDGVEDDVRVLVNKGCHKERGMNEAFPRGEGAQGVGTMCVPEEEQ